MNWHAGFYASFPWDASPRRELKELNTFRAAVADFVA
jgi:hypothetical protein